MKEKIKNFIKYEYTLFVIVTIIVLLYVLFFCIVLNKPYLLNNDQWFQYNIFYKEWIRLVINFIKTGSLPMYSWNMYLGTDFYSAMGYYCTGDLFLPILLIFRNNIELGLVIETILCVYISALLMNIFLIKYDIKQEINRIFISLIYAFGGMASLYFGNYMFHRFYAFLPLLFIGLLSYFHKKKMGTFIIATAILFLQSYYFMFPTLIFLLMFSIMLEMKKHNSFKMIIRDFFVLLGCLLLGYMMSAVITLPSMMYILNNSRLGNKLSNGLFWQRNTYAGLYMSLISYIPWGIDNIFLTTSQSSHDIYYSLFIGVIAFLSSISYILKKDNKCELITLIVLLTIACLKPLSSVMHGFSVASLRWVFLLEFYLLINAAKGLDENLNNIYIYIVCSSCYSPISFVR